MLVGAGGVGKTRLAREFSARLPEWQCRWIKPQGEAEAAGLITSGEIAGRSLLVVDYAEARDRTGVAAWFSAGRRTPAWSWSSGRKSRSAGSTPE